MKSGKNTGQLTGSNSRFGEFVCLCLYLSHWSLKGILPTYTDFSNKFWQRHQIPHSTETRWPVMSNPKYPAPSLDQGIPRRDLWGSEDPSGPESALGQLQVCSVSSGTSNHQQQGWQSPPKPKSFHLLQSLLNYNKVLFNYTKRINSSLEI